MEDLSFIFCFPSNYKTLSKNLTMLLYKGLKGVYLFKEKSSKHLYYDTYVCFGIENGLATDTVTFRVALSIQMLIINIDMKICKNTEKRHVFFVLYGGL